MDVPSISHAALERLLNTIGPRARGVLDKYRVTPEDSKDLIQETLLAFLAKAPTIRKPEEWFLGTLRNQCLLLWRSKRFHLNVTIDAAVLEAILDPRQDALDLAREVRSFVGTLPPRCRSVLSLRYKMGFDDAAIAKHLGCRTANVRKIAQRCLSALARAVTSPEALPQKRAL